MVDDESMADEDSIVGEVDGRADVVRDVLDLLSDLEAALFGRERD
jgi:hypothetical protein